jgi:acylphosphatase
MGERAALHVFLSGRVQGVAFRYYAEKWALGLGLTGWVRNLPDGRVEILAEGDKENLDQFLERVKQGPRMAQIEKADIEWRDYSGLFSGFEITGAW